MKNNNFFKLYFDLMIYGPIVARAFVFCGLGFIIGTILTMLTAEKMSVLNYVIGIVGSLSLLTGLVLVWFETRKERKVWEKLQKK